MQSSLPKSLNSFKTVAKSHNRLTYKEKEIKQVISNVKESFKYVLILILTYM